MAKECQQRACGLETSRMDQAGCTYLYLGWAGRFFCAQNVQEFIKWLIIGTSKKKIAANWWLFISLFTILCLESMELQDVARPKKIDRYMPVLFSGVFLFPDVYFSFRFCWPLVVSEVVALIESCALEVVARPLWKKATSREAAVKRSK